MWLYMLAVVGSFLCYFAWKRTSGRDGQLSPQDSAALSNNSLNKGLHILAIVNPLGGKRRAPRVWDSIVPALKAASCTVETIHTTRKNHATEIAREAASRPSPPHVCVCVGGDGFLFEVLNGLCENKDGTLPPTLETNIPVALVPEGTGNGCAASLDIRSTKDAARAILHGGVGKMDLMLVEQAGLRKVSGLSLAWGAIADHDHYAEVKFRALGGLRLILAPMLVIGGLQTRQGRVLMQLHANDARWSTRGGRKKITTSEVEDHHGVKWQCVSGAFIIVQVVNMPWVALDAWAVPGCTHDDGAMYAIIMRKSSATSRRSLLSLFLNMSTGGHVHLDCIEIYACTRLRIEPTDQNGHMCVDGEAVPYKDTEVGIWPGKASVYCLPKKDSAQ